VTILRTGIWCGNGELAANASGACDGTGLIYCLEFPMSIGKSGLLAERSNLLGGFVFHPCTYAS